MHNSRSTMRGFGKRTSTDIVVIGGGATGTAIARDAAMRGFRVTLVERSGLGSGTSGRFHGILHSGARYAVNDPETAEDCYLENQALRRIAAPAVLDTGGLFLALSDDEADHADIVARACAVAGIPAEEISVAEVAKREPNVSTKVTRSLVVPDGFVNGHTLLALTRQAAEAADVPAAFLTHHNVLELHQSHGRIHAVMVQDTESDKKQVIECDYVVNAAGIWAGRVSELAGVDVELTLEKGTMVVMMERLNTAILNRCRPETDGDLLVSNGKRSIMGTTSREVRSNDIDNPVPLPLEVASLISEGAQMVPRLSTARVLASYAGIRPLYNAANPAKRTHRPDGSRAVGRGFSVLDHHEAGIENFISVIGGKVTISRLMAEAAMDIICLKKNVERPCKTADVAMEAGSLALV